jgi:hypothetical protein
MQQRMRFLATAATIGLVVGVGLLAGASPAHAYRYWGRGGVVVYGGPAYAAPYYAAPYYAAPPVYYAPPPSYYPPPAYYPAPVYMPPPEIAPDGGPPAGYKPPNAGS